MTYANQTREKIVMDLLTMNYGVVVPYEMIIEAFWGSSKFSRPSPKYLAKIMSGVRNMLPYGKVEHVYGEGYIFHPIFYKRPIEVRRAKQMTNVTT